jgi:hypothetical protein
MRFEVLTAVKMPLLVFWVAKVDTDVSETHKCLSVLETPVTSKGRAE